MILGSNYQESNTPDALDWTPITEQVSKIHKTNIKKDVFQ